MSLMLASSMKVPCSIVRAPCIDSRTDARGEMRMRRHRHAEARGFRDDRSQFFGTEVRLVGIVARPTSSRRLPAP
jgi:hypothetical protein